MKIKNIFLLFSIFLISCGNNNSSLSTSNSSSSKTSDNSTSYESLNDNLAIITFNKKSDKVEECIEYSNNIDFQYDQINSFNLTLSDNLELSNDNNESSFAFSISKIALKIELYLANTPNDLYVGVINKYNVKAQYKLDKSDTCYYYSFADYLNANHLYITSSEFSIINKIIIYL